MNLGAALLAVSLLVLGGLSVPGKVAPHDGVADRSTAMVLEARTGAQLEAAGWAQWDPVPLTDSGRLSMRVFTSDRCEGALLLAALSADLDGLPLVRRAMRLVDGGADGGAGTLMFLYGGHLVARPPRLQAYALDRMAPLVRPLGMDITVEDRAVAAVALTGVCAAGVDLPWPVETDAELARRSRN